MKRHVPAMALAAALGLAAMSVGQPASGQVERQAQAQVQANAGLESPHDNAAAILSSATRSLLIRGEDMAQFPDGELPVRPRSQKKER